MAFLSEFTSEPHTTEVSADDVTENKMDNSDNYCPRLCNLCIWPDFTGYGFNMHAQKGVPGQYISSVDDNSPAIEAGLKAGDRIIDVNGDNIQSYAHTTVIQMIKSIPDRVRLLVVDKQTDEYYQSIGQIVYSAMPNVIVYYTKSRSVGECCHSALSLLLCCGIVTLHSSRMKVFILLTYTHTYTDFH